MKIKYITAVAILFLGLFQTSCKDFLDETDPTKVGTDVFYQNEAQMKQALNGVYSLVQNITNSAYLAGELQTDNTTIDLNPSDRGGAGGWEAFDFSTVNSGNGEIAAIWNNYYATLYNDNLSLEKLAAAEMDDAPKKK